MTDLLTKSFMRYILQVYITIYDRILKKYNMHNIECYRIIPF